MKNPADKKRFSGKSSLDHSSHYF